MIWIPPPHRMKLCPLLTPSTFRTFVKGSWNNKKVRSCVHWVSPGGSCCCSNVIAEGTDRCEGLNLTCCKSHTCAPTHTHWHTQATQCVCPCMPRLKPFVRRCMLASHLVSLLCPLLHTHRVCFSPCKTKLMIEAEWEAVCVCVCVCMCVCWSSRNCNGAAAAVLVMAGQLVWRVFRAGAVHCPLIAPTMPLWAGHTSTSHGPLSASVSAFLSVCHIYSAP